MEEIENDRIFVELNKQMSRYKNKHKFLASNKLISYQNFYNERIRSIIEQKIIFDYKLDCLMMSDDLLSDFLENKFYFVTFHPLKSTDQTKIERECEAFLFEGIHAFYKEMTAKIINRPTGRNSNLCPLMIAHLDFEGTRYRKISMQSERPHAHAVCLFHPKTINEFGTYLDENGAANNANRSFRIDLPESRFLESVTFKEFDNDLGSLDQMISYVTKFTRNSTFVEAAAGIKSEMIFPHVSPKQYKFFACSRVPIFTTDELSELEAIEHERTRWQ